MRTQVVAQLRREKKPVPEGYEDRILAAEHVFLHQRVFDSATGTLIPLTPFAADVPQYTRDVLVGPYVECVSLPAGDSLSLSLPFTADVPQHTRDVLVGPYVSCVSYLSGLSSLSSSRPNADQRSLSLPLFATPSNEGKLRTLARRLSGCA